ncbi:MAG: hypothetical protein ACO26M_07595 [Limnohabitans sp.]|jgi:hypothetical protein
MQAPAPVLYPLGRARRLHALLALLLLSTLALMAAVATSQPSLSLVSLMGVLLLPAVGLAVRASPAAGSILWWDGERWHLQGPQPMQGQLTLAFDWQGALLLRWDSPCPDTGPASPWLWIEQHDDPVTWKDVRRAIYWHTH